MSGIEKNLIRQAKQMKQAIPDRIKNKPTLSKGLDLYLNAFFDLRYDRNQTNFIPWKVIVDYSRHYNFSEEQEERLIRFTRALDVADNARMKKKEKA